MNRTKAGLAWSLICEPQWRRSDANPRNLPPRRRAEKGALLGKRSLGHWSAGRPTATKLAARPCLLDRLADRQTDKQTGGNKEADLGRMRWRQAAWVLRALAERVVCRSASWAGAVCAPRAPCVFWRTSKRQRAFSCERTQEQQENEFDASEPGRQNEWAPPIISRAPTLASNQQKQKLKLRRQQQQQQ